MSESLMDTPPETVAPETTQEETTSWMYADELPGQGEKPEWFMDKYKSVAEQAKAYPELAKKFGAFTGAPEEYSIPEESVFTGDPMLESFKELARESNMSQEGFSKVLTWYESTQMDNVEAMRAAEIEAIGKDRDVRIKSVNDWAKANLDPEGYEDLKSTLTTASAFRVVERLIDKTREKSIPATVNTAPGISKSEITARIADPRYQSSREFRQETEELMRKLVGSGEYHEIRQ